MRASTNDGCYSSQDCDNSPLVVITGGTGIVGSGLVPQMAGLLPDHKIVVLTRRPERVRLRNVTAVYADLQRSDLAMDGKIKSVLQSRATLIIHCAADTRFNLPLAQARLSNTEATRHILNLALACPRLVQFAHISTLYVAGQRKGLVAEEPLQHEAGYVNTYEMAKHEAEELVLAESRRLPIGIYRLSSVIDESGTGGPFRQLLRFVPWCAQFPFFPADSCVPVDLIASEWATHALAVLIAQHFTPGCIRHICAGERHSLPVGAVMDRVFACWELSGNPAVPTPRLIPLADFAAVSIRLPPGSGASRALAGMMTFIPHLSIAQPFESTNTANLLARSGVPPPDMNSLISRVFAEEFQLAEVRA